MGDDFIRRLHSGEDCVRGNVSPAAGLSVSCRVVIKDVEEADFVSAIRSVTEIFI